MVGVFDQPGGGSGGEGEHGDDFNVFVHHILQHFDDGSAYDEHHCAAHNDDGSANHYDCAAYHDHSPTHYDDCTAHYDYSSSYNDYHGTSTNNDNYRATTMNVLYVGSGLSATQATRADAQKLTICAVNNAWRIFTRPFDYWIHSGDFPHENHPLVKNYQREVSHVDYEASAAAFCKKVAGEQSFPQHHLGYTIFFQGLYWIMHELQPHSIYMLGFDHDYNPAKVRQWEEAGSPDPQNRFRDLPAPFFERNLSDSFYGRGTPDPMRLGRSHLEELFQRASDYAQRLDIRLLNASGVTTGMNPFPQESLP